MNALVERALNARTIADVEALEQMLQRAGATETRYLGDREANYSALSGSADPKILIFERVTNAFDSLIELGVARAKPQTGLLTSPRLAAQLLHRVPEKDLDPSGGTERKLARLIRLELLDSDDSRRRPTIAVRDYGIGVSNREAPGTILSLEESNKLKTPYTHGVFGKGGSLACMFSDATIYVMRKQPTLLNPGELDLVSAAVVRLVDLPDYGLPFFRYLVVPSQTGNLGLPWACVAKDANFEAGVYVAHINYQAERMGQQNWLQEESIYAYAQTFLFRPTFPFTLRDGRFGENKRRPEGREEAVLAGLGARLDRTEVSNELRDEDSDRSSPITQRSRVASVKVPGVGTARLRWHLFTSRDRRRSFVAKGNVVVFTHDGQVHHAWDLQRFVTMVPGRARVAASIFVEVETDDLPRKVCRQIFTSFRNELRKIPEAQALEVSVADWLALDPDLRDIEDRLTKEALQASAQKLSRAFIERLNRAIVAKVPVFGLSLGNTIVATPPRPPKPVEVLYPEPTYFTAPESVTVVAGERHVLYGSANAVDGFVPDLGTVELENVPTSTEVELSVGDLRRGRLQLRLDLTKNSAVGEHPVLLVLTWLRRSGGIGRIEWPLRVNVLSEPSEPQPSPEERQGAMGHSRQRSFVALTWSSHADQQERGWTEATAGDLQRVTGKVLAERWPDQYGELRDHEAEIPTIFLNKDFAALRGYLHGVARSSDSALQARRERYALAVGVAIAQLWTKEEQLRRKHAEYEAHPNGGEEPATPMEEIQMRRAISEAALGVLAVLPEFDRLAGEARGAVAVGS